MSVAGVTIGVIASIVVGAALLLAGGAKIAIGDRWPVQAGVLGAPAIVVPIVPWVEIALGALLCAQVARPIPALLAIALLSAFSGLVALRLAHGDHPPCACFGSLSARPLGWRHLFRNVGLIALAALAVAA